jgi:hypothetical protein
MICANEDSDSFIKVSPIINQGKLMKGKDSPPQVLMDEIWRKAADISCLAPLDGSIN